MLLTVVAGINTLGCFLLIPQFGLVGAIWGLDFCILSIAYQLTYALRQLAYFDHRFFFMKGLICKQ